MHLYACMQFSFIIRILGKGSYNIYACYVALINTVINDNAEFCSHIMATMEVNLSNCSGVF